LAGTVAVTTVLAMRDERTTTVKIDTSLRELYLGRSGRELLEDLAHRKLGMSAVRRIRSRLNLPEDEAVALGVRAVHDARREP
jgi:hypothetical protein